MKEKNKLESYKKVSENKDFCNVVMPFEDTKILEFNQYHKSDKARFIIYADLECLKAYSSGFSMSTTSSFKSFENNHDVYRGKECMKNLCEPLRKHAIEVINFKNKK